MARTVDGTANHTGAQTISNTLNVTGAVDFDSTFNVDGASTLAAVTVSGVVRKTGALKVATSQFNKTNNTLADITGLSVAVGASGTYIFRAVVHITTAAVAGVGSKVGVAYTGTTSAFRAFGIQTQGPNVTTVALTAVGTLNTSGGSGAGTSELCVVEGFLVSTGAGNLTIQFAQNTTNATQSSALTGSYLEVYQA